MRHRKSGNAFIIRLERGEEVMGALQKFLAAQKISSAHFTGIGALEMATLGFYHLNKKAYKWKNFMECELVALNGNAALLDNKPFIHAHAVLSDSRFSCYGGHLKEAVVGATLEIVMEKLSGKLQRKFDEGIGLNLLDV